MQSGVYLGGLLKLSEKFVHFAIISISIAEIDVIRELFWVDMRCKLKSGDCFGNIPQNQAVVKPLDVELFTFAYVLRKIERLCQIPVSLGALADNSQPGPRYSKVWINSDRLPVIALRFWNIVGLLMLGVSQGVGFKSSKRGSCGLSERSIELLDGIDRFTSFRRTWVATLLNASITCSLLVASASSVTSGSPIAIFRAVTVIT